MLFHLIYQHCLGTFVLMSILDYQPSSLENISAQKKYTYF